MVPRNNPESQFANWMIADERKEIRYKDNNGFKRLGFSDEQLQFHVKNVSWDLTSDDNYADYQPIDNGDVFTCGQSSCSRMKERFTQSWRY